MPPVDGRSPETMEALKIHWQVVEHLRARNAVVTGESAADAAPVELPRFGYLDRPAVILVGETDDFDEECERILETVFRNERVCLAMRACRPLRMLPEDADEDPSLAGEGRAVPRVLVLDPVREKVQVLEKSRLKATALIRAMTRASRNVWKEKIDRIVKTHMKLLTERDRLHDLATVAREAAARAEEEDERAEAEAQGAEIEKQLEALRVQEAGLWKLTRIWDAPEDPNPPPTEPELPDGWSVVRRPGQRPYYVRPDGSTTWDPPSASEAR